VFIILVYSPLHAQTCSPCKIPSPWINLDPSHPNRSFSYKREAASPSGSSHNSFNSLGSSYFSPLSLHHSLFDAVAVVSHLFPLTFSWLETLFQVGFDKKEIRSLLGRTLFNSLLFLSY
jgi:hypothetical protein